MSKRIPIVTDSASDISPEQVNRYGITVVPITVNFADDSYADGIELTATDFYKRLTTDDVLPKTSQPSPESFKMVYEKLGQESDTIISIHISGRLSGTLNSAEIAAREVDTEIITVDTLNASQGVALTVLTAAEAVKRGLDLKDVLAATRKSISSTFSVFYVDTLEYLKRNGRIGKAKSLLGSLLNIRPILYADKEGMVAPYDKVRGRSQVIPALLNAALKNVPPGEGVNLSIVHTNAQEHAEELLSELHKHYEISELHQGLVGPAIGAHIGPGAIGLMIQPDYDSLMPEG